MHTGYAWAARRSAISDLGGLGDIGILGSGDRHMAYALLGQVDKSFPVGISKSYTTYWNRWQERAEKYIQRKVGVVPGTVNHYWHGSKQHRRYQDRWKILVQDGYDPDLDIKYDVQGVLAAYRPQQETARRCDSILQRAQRRLHRSITRAARGAAVMMGTHARIHSHGGDRGPAERRKIDSLQPHHWAAPRHCGRRARHHARPLTRPRGVPGTAFRVDRYRRHCGGRCRIHSRARS